MRFASVKRVKPPEALKTVPYNINSPNLLQALTFKKENFLKASVFNQLDRSATRLKVMLVITEAGCVGEKAASLSDLIHEEC